MTALDDREQRFAYLAAGLGAAAAVVLWAPDFGKSAGVVLALIGVAMAALLAAAARRRSRLLTGTAAMLLFFGPWRMLWTAWLMSLVYLSLAAWLALRGARARAAMPRPAPDPSLEPRAERRPRKRRRTAPDTPEAARPRTGPPSANKRYTPPRRRT